MTRTPSVFTKVFISVRSSLVTPVFSPRAIGSEMLCERSAKLLLQMLSLIALLPLDFLHFRFPLHKLLRQNDVRVRKPGRQ